MLRLIESSVASIEQQLVLVAPPQVAFADVFNRVTVDPFRHKQLIREMQRLRGSIYLDEGNVKRHELTADGRHETPEDDKSWHLLMTDPGGRVRSCALYILYENATSIEDLRVRHCPLLKQADWKNRVKGAVESEMARARRAGLRFAELGGWAIAKERRGTAEGLMMALGTYGLARMLGGALGLTTANVAHSCSSILRRLGGAYLEFEGTSIPSYFDPRYSTEIDLLRFDSRSPSTKYANLIDIVRKKLANVSVIANPSDVAMVDRYHTAAVSGIAQPMFAA
jgi:hypothetical protein